MTKLLKIKQDLVKGVPFSGVKVTKLNHKDRLKILEIQAERNRPLINLTKTPGSKLSNKNIKQTYEANDLDVETIHYYPKTAAERAEFVNPVTKKRITEFQYKVYDLMAQIPRGQVSSYKEISAALNSHPRAVGHASRRNPFWPLPVPCHRVVASDGSIGGFMGRNTDSVFLANKKAKLMKEGCEFDANYNFLNNAQGEFNMFKNFKL